MDPRIGTELAGHRIEAVIGRGGASVVYLAEHVRLGRKVALKVLAPNLADDEDFRKRFIRESRIAAAMDHPSIVTIYDAGEVEDVLYISMRYVEGSDLGRLLRVERKLEASRTILLLSQVAAALDAAHAKGLVHRDVKPGNVLLDTSESGLERAYLADFGISKRTTTGSGLTRTGQFVGSVDYVAPEQIRGDPIDGRTDVYSLGCVLYQCLEGEVPFPGDTEVATIYRHLHDTPPTRVDLDPSNAINEVVAQALAKSKEERYPSCTGLIEAARGALTGFRETPTVVGRVVPTGGNPSPRSADTAVLAGPAVDAGPRRSWWVAAVGMGVLAVVGVGVLAWPRDDPVNPVDDGTGGTGAISGPTSGTPPETSEAMLPSWNVVKERTKFGEQVMDDVVVADDGLVVAGHVEEVGGDAAMWTAASSDRWRRSSSQSLGGPGDQRATTVAEYDSRLVAGGWNDEGTGVRKAEIWYSDDGGRHWRSVPQELSTDVSQIRDFAESGSILVAVGGVGPGDSQDAAVWTSLDGITWAPVDDPDLEGPGDQQIWSVRPVAGRLVGVGYTYQGEGSTYDAAVWTSTDGRDWTRVDPATFEVPGHQLMKAAAGGDDGRPLVVVGCEDDLLRCDPEGADSDAAVWVSEDGRAWTKVDLEGSEGAMGEGIQAMFDVTRDGDTFVAVGRATANTGDLDGANWISTDGVTWDLQLRPESLVADLGGPGEQTIRALTPYRREGYTFIAVGVTGDPEEQDAIVWSGS